MSNAERSLLLFLETQAVDHGGLIHVQSMNDEDVTIAKRWAATGFIEFGRVAMASLQSSIRTEHRSQWVRLSGQAFVAAATERQCRADRLWSLICRSGCLARLRWI